MWSTVVAASQQLLCRLRVNGLIVIVRLSLGRLKRT